MTVEQAFRLAVQHHQAGRLPEAEGLYRQILSAQPAHVEALRLLGLLAHQCGQTSAAIDLIRRALNIQPQHPIALANLGEAYRALGKFNESVEAYRNAVRVEPNNALTLFHLGNVFAEMGELDESTASYQQALQIEMDNADLHNNLGIVLARRGRSAEAVESFRRATRLRPDYADAHNNLGIALAALRRWDESMAAYRRAIELRPDLCEAWNNLGNARREQGDFAEAEKAYRQALRIREDYADASANLGIVLFKRGRWEEGMAACRKAVQWHPGHPEALNNLGIILADSGQLDAAAEVFQELLALHPGDVEARCNFGNVLKDQGCVEEAIAAYRQALRFSPNDASVRSNLIYTMLFSASVGEAASAAEHAAWAQTIAEPLKRYRKIHKNDRMPDRRLRVGYVSADFRDHVIGRNVLPLFECHEHSQFEIFCYSAVVRPDAFTEMFRQRADHWWNVAGMGDDELSDSIYGDGIDILVDLAQHTAGNRLSVFERRPAPVQVSFAGYPESAGVEAIDYRITDRFLEADPSAAKIEEDETRIFLRSFWCYAPEETDVRVNALPARKNGWITFGSLNNFCKVNEPMLRIWAKVLGTISDSRLLLLCPEGRHRDRVSRIFEEAGVQRGRVEFATPRARRSYLELYQHLDVVLDTFPYNGHTTSLDALWMGVPVVTLAGERAVSRAGWSQLSNLDLSELVAFSNAEFVERAVHLAQDLDRLSELRKTLRSRMEQSVLMNAEHFTRSIETAYRAMWLQWCAKEKEEP